MKKLLLWVCALLLLLSSLAMAGADRIRLAESDEKSGIYVYYIPATKDNDEKTTAQYIARAIASRWPETTSFFGKYNAKAFKAITEVFTDGNSDGTGVINNKLIPSQPEAQACDYWFIVPQEAANKFIYNAELMDQCRFLLANEDSRLHVVLIGNRSIAIPAETALGSLGAEGKTDWMQVASTFSADQLPSSSFEDRDIHTGSFFTAALYGEPVDLAYTLAEDGTTRMFTMPETGKAFVLVRWTEAAGSTDCVDATGNPCEKADSEIAVPKGKIWTGTLLSKMAGDSVYSVSCTGGDVDFFGVYWYPNIVEIKPELIQEGAWSRGENYIKLTVGNDIGRPEDFIVQFDYQVNDGPFAQISAEYDAENRQWQKKVTADTSTESVSVVPSVRLNMKDGNKIWEWHGEKVIFDVLSEGVKKSSQAPEKLTLWYDSTEKLYGQTTCSWSDIFTFNPEDHPEFDCRLSEDVDAACIRYTKTERGFTIRAEEGEELPETCTIKLSATLPNENAVHTIEIRRASVSEILQAITIKSDKEDKNVPVGGDGQIKIRAEISSEILELLQDAIKQKAISFTVESLILACKTDTQSEQSVPLTFGGEGEGLEAELIIAIPENASPGASFVHTEIRLLDQEKVITERDIAFTIVNKAPEMIQGGTIDDEIRMGGFPWSYTKIENLLAQVFGTNKLFDLFKDPETDLVSATVKVYNAQQEEIFNETVHNAEDETEIIISQPGEYDIILTAYDGVNESEPYTQMIKVYSFVMRIASYAAAALAGILLILVIVLVIRQVRKPSFENISIRAFISTDDDQDTAVEVLNKCKPVSLDKFGKKKITLATALILCRQPELNRENMIAAEDIILLPTKHNELSILFGKEALKLIGRSEKKELLAQGNMFRVRMGNTYIQIENVRP